MIIHAGEQLEIPQEPRPLVLKRLINIDEHSTSLSMTWVRIWGHHDRVVNETSERAYYILSGTGRFLIGDADEPEPVTDGDVVFIAAGTPYEFDGEMTYVVVNGPAYATDSDRVLPSLMNKLL